MIKYVLVLSFIVLFVYSIRLLQNRRLAQSITLLLCSILGIGFSIYPDGANAVASLLGVGRGADLVFYIFILVFIVALIRAEAKTQKLQEEIDLLTTEIALRNPKLPS